MVLLGRRPDLDPRVVQPADAHPHLDLKQTDEHEGKEGWAYIPGIGGEAEAAEGHVGGGEEAAAAADVVGEVDGNVASARSSEPALHLEDTGGRGAVGGGEREQHGEEEERGGRRGHCARLEGLIGTGCSRAAIVSRVLLLPPPPRRLLPEAAGACDLGGGSGARQGKHLQNGGSRKLGSAYRTGGRAYNAVFAFVQGCELAVSAGLICASYHLLLVFSVLHCCSLL